MLAICTEISQFSYLFCSWYLTLRSVAWDYPQGYFDWQTSPICHSRCFSPKLSCMKFFQDQVMFIQFWPNNQIQMIITGQMYLFSLSLSDLAKLNCTSIWSPFFQLGQNLPPAMLAGRLLFGSGNGFLTSKLDSIIGAVIALSFFNFLLEHFHRPIYQISQDSKILTMNAQPDQALNLSIKRSSHWDIPLSLFNLTHPVTAGGVAFRRCPEHFDFLSDSEEVGEPDLPLCLDLRVYFCIQKLQCYDCYWLANCLIFISSSQKLNSHCWLVWCLASGFMFAGLLETYSCIGAPPCDSVEIRSLVK